MTIVGGVFLLAAGGVAYGGHHTLNDMLGNTASADTRSADDPLTGDDIEKTAGAFLAAWAAGDAERAARLTNNAEEAGPALTGYRDEAHVAEVALTPGTRVGATVRFSVKAVVAHDGQREPWSYSSELTVVRGLTTGAPLVDWQPSVVHPRLGEGRTLAVGETTAPRLIAVDRNGEELTAERYPSLGPVLAQLRERYAAVAEDGAPATELRIESTDGSTADETLLTLAEGKPARLATTLDAGIQRAAEEAVRQYAMSSVVALEPSTGNVLGVANNRTDEFNAAFEGRLAPGSTMKMITATMLMDHGLATPDSPAPCTPEATWYGRTFTNLDGFSIPDGSYATSFARSCNTAFIKPVKQLDELGVADTALGRTAEKYFGIGEEWHTGIASFDGSVPPSSQAETAASYIGQGKVQMNALTVASVVATAEEGVFRQPVLVDPSLIDGGQATAQPLPYATAARLRSMLELTATAPYGTAAEVMAGVPFPKGAKTGSAETGGDQPNSLFAGYSGDLAAAAVVENGGHGADTAGPIVRKVLLAGDGTR
ncbi:penicillin-binding transpeptidase domain-containing protein [Streptomyces capparidis]